MARYKWQTDDLVIEVEPEDLTDYEQIILSLKGENAFYEKIKDSEHDELYVDAEQGIISCRLSQEETAQLGRDVKLQVNVYYTDGARAVSNRMSISYDKNLHNELMPDE